MRPAGAISAIGAAALALTVPLPGAHGATRNPLPRGPSDCHARGVRAAVVGFARAFDRGDSPALDASFAEEPDFQWYATEGRIGRAAMRRRSLLAYFRARHRRGERLRVSRFRFNGNSPNWGNFEMTLRRRIRGVAGSHWQRAPGKGAAVCRGGTVRLIVMTFFAARAAAS